MARMNLDLEERNRALPAYALRTCGQCQHFFEIRLNGPQEIGQKQGQCRRMPPASQVINAQQNASFYPTIPSHFGACGEFKSVLSLRADDDPA